MVLGIAFALANFNPANNIMTWHMASAHGSINGRHGLLHTILVVSEGGKKTHVALALWTIGYASTTD